MKHAEWQEFLVRKLGADALDLLEFFDKYPDAEYGRPPTETNMSDGRWSLLSFLLSDGAEEHGPYEAPLAEHLLAVFEKARQGFDSMENAPLEQPNEPPQPVPRPRNGAERHR